MAIDPNPVDLQTFLAEDDDGPVVMLNLLRFADGGRALYDEYSRTVGRTFLPRYGGTVLYAGDGLPALVGEDGQAWDAVLVVRYPSRSAFRELVEDPEYRKIAELRSRALSEAVLQPTAPW
jgi:uncharacterized protein (DUF1330 family)